MSMLQYLVSSFLLAESTDVSKSVPIYAKHLASEEYEINTVKKVLGAETFSVLLTVSSLGDLFLTSSIVSR